jgi:signal transduction histidine kinase
VSIRRLVRAHGDLLLAGATAVLFQVEIWTLDRAQEGGRLVEFSTGQRALSAAVALLLSASLVWRARAPIVVLALAAGATVLSALVAGPLDEAAAYGVYLVVVLYSVGAHTEGARAVVGGIAVVALIPVALVIDPEHGVTIGDVTYLLTLFGGPWIAGRAIRYRRTRERRLTEHALTLDREREQDARAAVEAERARIARELHDVVAHAISVVVVQARGGRRSVRTDPDEAEEALDAIETLGRDALGEMRRLLGILRESDEEMTLGPQPSLRHLDALVQQVSDAGLSVELSIEGEPANVTPGLDLAAYRIVQEALTNTLRHAGPATARVVVRYRPDHLDLEIADTGVGTSSSNGRGQGLIGMRERASLYGGAIEVGNDEGGGFAVRAKLPLEPSRP